MGLAYKADFMACRPWGNQGDHKNDGFLKSERRLFQVYAPNEMMAAKAIKKIEEDFNGAKAYWGTHFDKWVFAHNATDGLPPHIQKALLAFEKANPGIAIEPWGLVKSFVARLPPSFHSTIFNRGCGFVPSDETKSELGFSDLQVVLEAIASHPAPALLEVKDVPTGKIEANALSENVSILLKAGMAKAPLVEAFFEKWHDETLGERVAESFRAKYQLLRCNFVRMRYLGSWSHGLVARTEAHRSTSWPFLPS